MGRLKKPTINIKNHNDFMTYIRSKPCSYPLDLVLEFDSLINKADAQFYSEAFEYIYEHDLDECEILDRSSPKHKLKIDEIESRLFRVANDLVDAKKGLKTAFNNAMAQRRFKIKNQDRERNERLSVIEMRANEIEIIKKIKAHCKQNDLVLSELLGEFLYQLKNK